jgi:hypothetical protein
MTAAQTKARARFKAAVKEAAKLRAKDPKLSQADAVKKAWAILYGKKVGAAPKKTPAKKTGKRKSPETHKDTKSHNVNIRVVSGPPVKTAVKKALRAAGKRLKHGYATVPGTVRKLSGLQKIVGAPNTAKYYIAYFGDDNIKRNEYFDKLPKDRYLGIDRIYYVSRMTKDGTALIPLKNFRNNLPVKKSK